MFLSRSTVSSLNCIQVSEMSSDKETVCRWIVSRLHRYSVLTGHEKRACAINALKFVDTSCHGNHKLMVAMNIYQNDYVAISSYVLPSDYTYSHAVAYCSDPEYSRQFQLGG